MSVDTISFNLGLLTQANLDLMCLLRGSLTCVLASWVVLFRVCLIVSFDMKAKCGASFS